jgi:imidazolonepropionase-like amidohydrolase
MDQPGLSREIIAAAVTKAHQLRKKVTAHAYQVSAYRLAVDAGADIITPAPVDGHLDEETIQLIATKDIAVVPTLSFLRRGMHEGLSAPNSREQGFANAKNAVRSLYDADVKICAGTAANQEPRIAVPAGEGLHEELRLLVEAGLSNADALRSATSVPAVAFGLHDRGVAEIGYRADLVLIEGDLLEDMSFEQRIRKVWIAGVKVEI